MITHDVFSYENSLSCMLGFMHFSIWGFHLNRKFIKKQLRRMGNDGEE